MGQTSKSGRLGGMASRHNLFENSVRQLRYGCDGDDAGQLNERQLSCKKFWVWSAGCAMRSKI